MDALCGLFGKTRQAYYKGSVRVFSQATMEGIIIKHVISIREEAPRIGGRKLHLMLEAIFHDEMIGRDKFFDLLKRNSLLIKRKATFRTTNSYHRYHKWPNLIKETVVVRINQIWVADITYLQTVDGACYLHIVTDLYSHKIIGWCVSTTLEARYTMIALDMAIAGAADADFSELTHHSDRGVQYCCNLYVKKLQELHASISMTEDSNPTDNAVAERVNGILKQEWLLDKVLDTVVDAHQAVEKAVAFYNTRRPHMSIGMLCPSDVYDKGMAPKKQAWKSKSKEKLTETG